jgi:hypothetical protein
MAATLRDDLDEAKPVRYPVAVTNRTQSSAVRRAARVLALAPAILVTSATGTAFADPPASWEDNPGVSPLHAIIVLGVIPVGLFLLITLLVYVPAMSRGQSYHPGEAWRGEPEWFGGPRKGVAAIDTAQPPAIGSGEPGSDRGGASGRW